MKSVIFIALAFFLTTSSFTYYPGDIRYDTDSAGFLSGIVHGVLAPITLIGAIFTDLIMYETSNSGWFYDFAFLMGLLITWGGSPKGTRNIVKNYYNMPGKHKGKKESAKSISDEDHDKISKMVEEKVSSAIKIVKPKKKIKIKKKIVKKKK